MALSIPYVGAEAPSLPVPYAHRVEPRNTLAAPAPVTWPVPRVAPRAELAALQETPAGRDLHASAVAVFSALWTWANIDGIAWPGIASIARRAHVCKRTVYSALDALERAGLVVRQVPALRARRRYRQTNTYTLASVAALPQVPRSESPRPPRRVAPRAPAPSPSSPPCPAPAALPPSPEAPAVEPVRAAPVALPVVVAELVQVQRLHPKGPGEIRKENARTGAQARAATAPSVEPSPRAAAPSSHEATAAKRLTRAERSAANRAAWAARTRPSASAARAPAPRRAPGYQATATRVPDPAPALAALREWRKSHQPALPALGREPARESAPQAPVFETRRPDLAPRSPIALRGLLEAFARVPLGPHVGSHGSPRPCSSPAGPSRSPASDALGAPRVEARSTPLWSPDPRR